VNQGPPRIDGGWTASAFPSRRRARNKPPELPLLAKPPTKVLDVWALRVTSFPAQGARRRLSLLNEPLVYLAEKVYAAISMS